MFKFVLLFINVFASLAMARSTIEFRSENLIEKKTSVMLNDLATASGFSESQFEILNNFVIAESWDGQDIKLDRQELANRVKLFFAANEQLRGTSPIFVIPENVSIRYRSLEFNEQNIKNELLSKLKGACTSCKVEILAIRIPRTNLKIDSWRIENPILELRSSQLFSIEVEGSSRKSNLAGTVVARFQQEVLAAKRNLNQGERIQPGDFEIKHVDISSGKDFLQLESDVIGQQLLRAVQTGQGISRSDLRREAAIKRGQLIRVVLGNEGFEVSASANAEESGFVGDLIRLKTIETQKVLNGRVIEQGKVRVE
jgi:flagellar basal body P-ring formation protein FlgA